MKRIPEGYFAILFREKNSKTIGVRFPDYSGIITYGSTWKDAEKNAYEALYAASETELDKGLTLRELRKPKVKKGERLIFVSLEAGIRTAYRLRGWRETVGLTQKEVARRLGVSYQAYQRMERPGRSNLTIATLEKIAKALDGKLVVELKIPKGKRTAA